MQCLTGKLLNLTHSQWIFRNIIKHHHTNRTIKLDVKQDTTKKIERQSDMGLCNLPPESKCMLEIDTSELLNSKIDSQQYWLYAIMVARTAGSRALKLSEGKMASWNSIIKTASLPTSQHTTPQKKRHPNQK